MLKAIALAHGLTGYAKSDNAVIMRNVPGSAQKDFIPVRIKQWKDDKANDVAHETERYLYTSGQRREKGTGAGTEAAIAVGTGVAIYRAY